MFEPQTYAVLGDDNAEHRVVVTAIPSPNRTSHQGHARCVGCGWQTVHVLPSGALTEGTAHLRANPNRPTP